VCLSCEKGGETPPFVRRKPHGRRQKYTDEDRIGIVDQDSRVPVMSLDGQHMLSGNDAPALRDLESWLEEHPNYAPLGDVITKIFLISFLQLLI